jgi:MoCo/4Fe-4S cofactor protein with predicted Tat translocation signal
MKRPPIDPELLRDRLAAAQGKQYWSSLQQLADDPAVTEMLQREFPDGASEWQDPISRRRFLSLMGASLALAGLTSAGCMRPPTGTIRPFVRQPENVVLGKPLYYATSMTLSGYAVGLLVESHEGRPTKAEGNPLHPASLGAAGPLQQASPLGLYDPDRAQMVSYRGQPRSWPHAAEELRARLRPGSGRDKGQRVALLTEAVGSPTLNWQLGEFLREYPQAVLCVYEPVNRDNASAGGRLAFNDVAYHSYNRFDRADLVVSLDCDFLSTGPSHLADTRAFTSRRRNGGESKEGWNRLYVIETNLSITGVKADHRLAVRPGEVERFVRALAAKVGLPGVSGAELTGKAALFIDAIAKELTERKGKGNTLLVAGDGQPRNVHALVHSINVRLGNAGKTVIYTEPPLPPAQPARLRKLDDLVRAIEREEIDTLLILGGNPAYTAPADVDVKGRLEKHLARYKKEQWLAVHCSPYFDETARLCHWHVPQSHFLETWSDAVAFDGTKSIVQPLIAPLYASKSPHEILSALSRRRNATTEDYDDRSALELVRDYWRANQPAETRKDDFETFWQKALHDGVISHTKAREVTPVVAGNLAAALDPPPDAPAAGTYDVHFAPDPGVYDGRFANLGWLQEWPRPINRLTWDNAAIMSRATAERLGVTTRVGDWRGGEHGDLSADKVRITVSGRSVEAPVFIVPGHVDDAVTLFIGFGRTHAGKVGTKVGVNVNGLRTAQAPWSASGAKIEKINGRHVLACVQSHHDTEGRDVIRSGPLQEYKKNPHFLQGEEGHGWVGDKEEQEQHPRRKELPTLFPLREYPGYRWGMAIDLTACVGCGACVVACQSENNTPVVGKEQVVRGREMHWIRVSTYFEMPKDKKDQLPRSWHFQPVTCHHCETAPCEVVCPVEATVHSDEGLNDMVYNRCVGTRYCSNGCPYKVRRFNFLNFTEAAYTTPSLKLLYNPDVTVRTRGVMEKCTFCVQRISYARIEAGKEAMDELELPPDKRTRRDTNGPDGSPRKQDGKEIPLIRDGEVVTACQAACPAEAIVFGDLNDKKSRVRALHDSPLHYELLGDHGTRPRLVYLGELRNPNPDLDDALKKLAAEEK